MVNTLICLQCGHEWFQRTNKLPKRCPKCGQQWNSPRKWKKHPRVLVTCFICGVEFMRKQSHVDMGYAHHLCGPKCHGIYSRSLYTGAGGPSWKGDNAKKDSGGARARRHVPTKPCELCGAESQRHHKDENTLNNDPSNIAFLCAKHHSMAHPRAKGFRLTPKTHCKRGHLFDEVNTQVGPQGWRHCRVCRAAAQRRYRERQKARLLAIAEQEKE